MGSQLTLLLHGVLAVVVLGDWDEMCQGRMLMCLHQIW